MIINLESQKFITILDFFRTLQECSITNFGRDNIKVYSAYPNDTDIQDIKTPIVTYYYNQSPGSFGSSNTKEIRGRQVLAEGTYKSSNGRDVKIIICRQRFDYRIVFETWETSGERADRFTHEFRNFLSTLTGFFQGLGIASIIFQGCNGDQNEKQWKTDLVRRELVYQVSMDEITSVTSPTISAFGIEGFVYKTIVHLMEREGTAIDSVPVEASILDGVPVAASTPKAGTAWSPDQDAISIQLREQ